MLLVNVLIFLEKNVTPESKQKEYTSIKEYMLLCCSLILCIVIIISMFIIYFWYNYCYFLLFFSFFFAFTFEIPILLKTKAVPSRVAFSKHGFAIGIFDLMFVHLLLKVFLCGKHCIYNYWYNICFFIPELLNIYYILSYF